MLVLSHRGPFSFRREPDGGFEARRGAGGIVTALGPLLLDDGGPTASWIAAALSDDDRAAVAAGATGAPGVDLRLLALDPDQHRLHYDVVSNGVVWFLHHGLFDLVRRPRFDHRFEEAWEAYVGVNRAFAAAACEAAEEHDVVLVQDYQLALAAGMVHELRPDLRVVHFTHTPFCGPNSMQVLPDHVARTFARSMSSVPAGFHTTRWSRAYTASVASVLGSEVPAPSTFAASLGPDPDALAAIAASDEASAAGREIDELVGDRLLVLRSDRVEPSKNIVRGFLAFDRLLELRPDLRDRVVFVALLYPSRESLPEYLAYANEVEQAVDRVNERWGNRTWTPVELDVRDDFPRTVAALARYDALLVNPLKDGLNLVAKEGPVLNRRDGVLCLSPEAGAWEELASAAERTHPYDLEQAAGAIGAALDLPAAERPERATRLRDLASARTPVDWLADQVTAAR